MKLLRSLSTLQIALCVSIAVHAVLLTVRFVDPEAFNRVFEDTPLEVVLVNARTNEKPEKAKAIAQAKVEAAARKLKLAIAGPKPKPADPRPAKGKHGVDMTTGKPVPGARVKPIRVDTKDKETFDAL